MTEHTRRKSFQNSGLSFHLRTACSAVFLLLASVPLLAQTTWTANGGNTDWGDAFNWSAGVPGAATPVTIPTNPAGGPIFPILNVNGTAGSLTIEAGASVDVSTRLLTVNGVLTGAGTLNGDTGTVTVTGDFTISTYNATSGNTNVGGNFTPGAFAHNNGTVVFTGALDPQSIGAFTYRNVTLSKGGAALRVRLTGDTTITNTLTLTTGTLQFVGNTLTLNSPLTMASANGTLNIGLTGTLNAGANTVTVNGGTIQASTGTLLAGGLSLGGGTYNATAAATVTLGASGLSMTSGTITANAATFSTSGSVSITGGTFNENTSTLQMTGAGTTVRVTPARRLYNFTVAPGAGNTVSVSVDALSVAGTLTLTSGTLAAGALGTSVAGDFARTGGAFTSTGTLTFNGAAAQNADLSSSTLNNLTVANAVGVALGAAASVGGTLTINAGCTLSKGTFALGVTGSVSASGTLNMGGAGTLTVGGDFSLGTLSNAAGSTLVLNGGGAQAITPNAQTFGAVQKTGAGTTTLLGTATFASLSVTGGTFTLGGGTATSLTVNGNLTNSATFNLNSTAVGATVQLAMANGTAINNTGGTFRVLSSTANVTLSSPGTTTLSGNEIDLNSRTLRIGGFSTNVLHTLNGANDILVLTGAATFSGGLTLSGAGSQVQVGTQTLTVTGLTVTTGTVTVSTGSIAAGASAVNTGAGGAVTFSGAGSMTSGTVTNAGAITLAGGTASTGAVNNTGSVTFGTAAGASWTVTGNFTSSGTVTNTFGNSFGVSGNVSVSGIFGGTLTNSTITLTGAGRTINTAVQIGNLATSGAGTTVTVVTNALNLAGTLSVVNGTSVSLAGLGATIAGAATGAGTGTLNGGTAGVTINGDFTVPNYQATSGTTSLGGAVVTLSTFWHNNGTVQLTRNGAQALTTNTQNFNNLTLTNVGTDVTTVTNALTVLGALDVQANQTLAVGNNVLSVTGTTGNAGTITLGTAAATFTGLVSNAGGTLTGGSGTITLTGGISGGNFTGTNGTAFVGGVFTPAFTHNSGTVEFNGGAAQTFGAYTFNNLTINNPAGVSVSAGLVTVQGQLAMMAGTLDAAGFTVTVNGDLSINGGTLTSSGTLNVSGNIVHTAGGLTSTGTLLLFGAVAQAVNFTGSTLSGLAVFKTGGTATAGSDFSVATYTQSSVGAAFSVPAARTMTVTTSATVTAGTLALAGPYSGGGATFTVNGGTVTVGTNAFVAGAMTVSSGSFTQTGVNGGANTAASLLVSGTGNCAWDSTVLGGTLTISGACTQTGGTLAFNNKNVTLGTSISGSIEFYDLIIPAGITLTPGAGSIITVRRSMTIQNTGSYSAANNPTLVLGGGSSVAGGIYTDNNAVKVNLGTVTVSGSESKSLATAMTATNLTIAGGPLAAGAQTLTVTGNLDLNAGTLTSSGTVSLAGNLLRTAPGALTSTGTLEFTGGGVQTFNPAGSTFSTISISKSGGSLSASASFAAATLSTAAANYGISLNGGSVTNLTTFSNSGTLAITGGFTFGGGAVATAPSGKSLSGIFQATGVTNLNFGVTPTTITGNATLQTTGAGTVTLAGTTVNAGATLILGNGNATTVNTGAIDGAAGTSGLGINSTGTATIGGAVGATAMGTVTVTQSGGTAFQSTLNATAATLTNTAGTIDFQDAVTIGTLNTAAQGYGVRLGNGGTITNAVTFSNTGTLTISNGFTFNGGATATQGPKSIEGTISTSNDALDFGATNVTLTDATTLSTGTGNITLGPTTSAGFDLALQGSGADTIASAALGAGTLNLTGKTGGSVTVTGSLTAQALTTVGAACAVSLNGGGTVTNLTTFSNSGALTLGNDAGDSLTFTGGVTALLPSGINVAGTVATGLGAGQNISLGDGDTGVVLSDTSILSAGAGNITLGGTVNGNPGLTLNSTGSTTLSAAIGGITPLASFTTNAVGTTALNGGSIRTAGPTTFGDAVVLGAETTLNSGGWAILFSNTLDAGNRDLILAAGIAAGTTTFTGAVSNLGDGIGPALTISNGVTGLVRFSNTLAGASGIQAANAGNQVRFDGNVALGNGDTGTSIAAVLFDGLNFSGWDGLSFGATSLSGAAVSVTSNGSSVTFATIDGAQNLGINAGAAGTISVTGAVGASTPPGTITITQSNGTTFSGNLSAATLAVSDTQAGQTVSVLGNLVLSGGNLFASGPTAYHVSLTGAVNSVSGTGTFANTGNLTLGDADTDSFTFTGGLTATATATNSIRGTIATGGGAGQDLTFDTFTLAGVTTLNAGAAGQIALTATATITVSDLSGDTSPDLVLTATLVSALNITTSIAAGGTADLGSSGFTIGTLSNLGTLRLTGLQATHNFTTAFDTDSGITEYYGTGAGSLVFTAGFAGGTYWDLRIASSGAGVHTLQNPVTVNNDLHIAAGGVLDVSGANHLLTVNGNWRNDEGDAGFVARSGTVDFNKTAGVIEIRGNNTWYVFQVLSAAPGLEVHFENDLAGAGIQIRQRIAIGGIFRIRGTLPANSIRLDRLTDTGIDPGNPPADPGDDIHFWFLDLTPGATLDMQYVEVYYSNARANPISVPANVSATPYSTYFSFKWLDFLYLIYSYTEDSDYNGKIDRIRVTAEGAIGTLVPGPVWDFSDFVVEVDGYEVDTTKGVNGYERPVSGVTFYIHLVEKPYLDTGAAPDWHIVRNETLFDEASGIKRVGTLSRAGGSDWMTPSDTAWPVIGYTLSVPGFGETFVRFSEPVVQTGGGSLAAGDFGAGSFTLVSGTAPQTLEAVVGLGPYAVGALATGATNLTVTASTRDLGVPPYWDVAYNGQIIGPPPPTYPDPVTGYTANPNLYGSFGSPGPNPGPMTRPAFRLDRGGNNVHRVSDLMISVPPSDTVGAWSQANPNSFFVWPLWAKDEAYVPGVPDVDYPTIPELDASGQYVGFVRLFDGSRFLRDQDFDLQVEDATGLGNPELLYKSNVLDLYRSAVPGIWLPDFLETDFSGLAALPFAGTATKSGAGGPPIWDYSFLASDPEIYDRGMLEFYFRLPGGPADLYAGHLDMDPDATALPADWYRRVRPFGILIRNVVTQKGGVSILNNVIDPTTGERTRLHYTIGQAGPVTITVFTLDGDVVRSLQRGTMTPGDYTASWDGRNRAGDPVARGMYFIRIVAPGIDEIRKVMVVRY